MSGRMFGTVSLSHHSVKYLFFHTIKPNGDRGCYSVYHVTLFMCSIEESQSSVKDHEAGERDFGKQSYSFQRCL